LSYFQENTFNTPSLLLCVHVVATAHPATLSWQGIISNTCLDQWAGKEISMIQTEKEDGEHDENKHVKVIKM